MTDMQKLDAQLDADYETAFAGLEKIAADRGDDALMEFVQALRKMAVPDKRDPYRRTAAAAILQAVSIWLIGGSVVGRVLEFEMSLMKEVLGVKPAGE